MKPRAIVSVTDKTGVVAFAKALAELGFEVVSTGGTAKAIRDAGVEVRDVADVTGFPEMMDGRVKTLHPLVHGGLLGDTRLETHRAAMAEAGIAPVTILAVNLYAFEKTVIGPHDMDQAIESIDIGGPAMIRAAAKNWANVAVVVDPADYDSVLEAVRGGTLSELRLGLCAKAFRHTAFYDSMIARYLTEAAGKGRFQETFSIGGRLVARLAGQGRDEQAALFADPFGRPGIAQAKAVAGDAPSVQVLLDADLAWREACRGPQGVWVSAKDGKVAGAETGGTAVAFRGAVDERAVADLIASGRRPSAVVGSRIDDSAVEAFRRVDWAEVAVFEAPEDSAAAGITVEPVGGGFVVHGTGRGL